MLPDPTVPPSLSAVLENLRWVFTTPSFATLAALATGLIANTGVGTVTGMLTGAGLARTWPHDRAHAFFSRAAWSRGPARLGPSRARPRRIATSGLRKRRKPSVLVECTYSEAAVFPGRR